MSGRGRESRLPDWLCTWELFPEPIEKNDWSYCTVAPPFWFEQISDPQNCVCSLCGGHGTEVLWLFRSRPDREIRRLWLCNRCKPVGVLLVHFEFLAVARD